MNRDFHHDNTQPRSVQSFARLITSADFSYKSFCFQWINIFVSLFFLQASSISGQIYSHKSDKDTINIPAYTAPSNIFYKHDINLAPNCNYTENFDNLLLSGSNYSDGYFNGNNQIVWNYTDARNEGTYGIDGNGIMFRNNNGTLSTTLPNGISSFSCNLKKAFTGPGNRQVALYVNDILVKTSAAFDGSDVQVFTVENINMPGEVKIEIRNMQNRHVVVDNISWTCYTGTVTPEINIKGNEISIPDASATPETANNTDFGAIVVNSTVNKTFVIENLSSGNLTLANPAVVFLNGSQGFTVSYQPAINPMNGFSAQNFAVSFTGTVPGVYNDTVTVTSDDADESTYTFAIKAQVLQPLITLNTSSTDLSLQGFAYAEAQGPSSTQMVKVDGSALGSDIIASASTNWEISSNAAYNNSNVPPYSTVSFSKTQSNEVNNKNLHIRLKDGLPEGSYSGTVTLTSPGAITRTVTLLGEVLPAIPDMKVRGGNQTIADGSSNPLPLNNTQFGSVAIGDSQIKSYTITNLGGAPLLLDEMIIEGPDNMNFSILNAPPPGTQLLQSQTTQFEIRFMPITMGTKTAKVVIANNDPDNNPYDFTIRGTAKICGPSQSRVLSHQSFETISSSSLLPYTVYNSEMYGPATGFSTGQSASGDKPAGNVLYSDGLRGYRIQGGNVSNANLLPYMIELGPADTSYQSEVDLSLRVAAFSMGSDTNGMDDTDVQGNPTTDYAAKIDYVMIEISSDGGVTWIPQVKVVSDELNATWGFNTAGANEGTRQYSANDPLIYFGSTAAQPYNRIKITALPAVSNLKVRISVQNNTAAENWILDDIRLTASGPVPKIWNGTAWSPSVPGVNDRMVITKDYSTAASASTLQVCQCEIAGGTLTVAEGRPLIISDDLINNGHIVVENNASLVQVSENSINSGSGTATVHRNANLRRLDYNYWASPVANQNLKTFSSGTLNNRFYTYNEGTDVFDIINPVVNIFGNNQSGQFESAAKGYAIRAANTYPAATATDPAPLQLFEGKFTGVLNNAAITFPLQYQSLPGGQGFNLVGNPYPSNIDFYPLADNNAAMITKTAYFWTNINPNPGLHGSGYPNTAPFNNYAVLNGIGGIPATVTGNSNIESATPTRILKLGQGFIVKALKAGTLTFSNAVRTPDASPAFFNGRVPETGSQDISRFWLHLTTPLNVVATTLIGYLENATDGYDPDYDAKLFIVGADALFTLNSDMRLGIQGRKIPFENSDIIALGTSHYQAGQHSLSLGNREGEFLTQEIWLKDQLTGVVTNLTENAYTFQAEAGLSEARFHIVYKPQTVLGTEETEADALTVYRNGNSFFVQSANTEITTVEVYDVLGRLVTTLQPRSRELTVDGSRWSDGVYIVRVERAGTVTSRRVIR